MSVKYLSLVLISCLILMPISSKPALISVGDKAPEVELPDMNDNLMSLSSLKGNLVLLSFWSTWCVSCNTIKNPEYQRLYEKYKDYSFKKADAFSMYSVAFDSDKNKWLRRISEKGWNWDHHVIDKDSYYSLYWWIYNINSIPASFLIDETGTIIGVNLTYDQIDRELAKRKKARRVPAVVTPTPTPQPPEPKPVDPPLVDSDTDVNTGNNTDNTSNEDATVSVETEVFKIQLGVLRNPDLRKFSNLSDLGKLETESATNRLKRVLLGDFAYPTAKSTLVKVKARGYKDAFIKKYLKQVEQPLVDTDDTEEEPPTANILRSFYKIQLGAFRTPNIDKFSPIADIGPISTENTASGLQRVLIGEFETKTEANTALGKVKAKGFGGFVVYREAVEMTLASVDARARSSKQDEPSFYGTATPPQMVFMRGLEFPALKESMINKPAPEIALKNIEGNVTPLSAQGGKYRILYLWATWSGTARDNHEDLNNIYAKYKNKKFDIYSVAFDQNASRWEQVIEEDGLQWKTHVLDSDGTESAILSQYNVEYLPALFLIDPNGNVVAENLSYEQLDTELHKRLK